jgi:hypothetical protein
MILQLAKNITVERESGGKPIGDIVFKKADFALFVDVTNLDVGYFSGNTKRRQRDS